jgi:bile acid-coenzyme A ligase
LLERANVDGKFIDDVAWGCCTQHGAQAENVGRNSVLSSKRLPISVPAFTLDRQCGSAQQALHLAAQAVMSGTQDCVIAGGVEMMSVVPMDCNVNTTNWEMGPHTGQEIHEVYGDRMKVEYAELGASPVKFDQFVGAELVAKKYGITRQDADEFAMRSHTLAAAATKAGRFAEVAPLPCRTRPGFSKVDAPKTEMHTVDEGIRPNINMEALGKLKPILKGGVLTAAAASQICDGASAMLICNERGLERLGVRPRARVVSLGLAGIDPIMMLEGPVPATHQVLAKAGLTIDDIDLVEVNEAFSSIPLAWARAMTNGDLSKVNVNGGAIARGHPMGASGGLLMSNLIGELERRGGRYGLLTMCESGGTANATIVERVAADFRTTQAIANPRSLSPSPTSGGMGVSQSSMPISDQNGQCLMSIAQALRAVALWKGDAPAMTCVQKGMIAPVSISFRELDRRSNQLARAYQVLGVQKNDLVTIALPTGIEFVVACFACWKLGATPNNVSPKLTFRERDEIVQLATPRLVVGVPALNDPKMRLHDGFRCIPEGFQPDARLSSEALPDAFANTWLVACSGGSTGRPKLIYLVEPSIVTMKNIGGGRFAMPDGFAIMGGGRVNGVDLTPCPLSHNAPFHIVINGILGASHQVVMTKFDAEFMLQLVQDYRCTFSYAVPTIMKRVWDLPTAVRLSYDVSSLEGVFHMAAPMPPKLKDAWCNWLGPKVIYELYGPTEAMLSTLIRGDEWLARPKIEGMNLVGRPVYGELKIVDSETKEVLPPHTMGEVWMRHHERRQTYYYRGSQSVVDEDGFETMGDMGLLDEHGYLHLGDRKKDMVLIGGQNVYPAEVEAALEEHPAVKSAIVVGLAHEDLGQVLHAAVYTGSDRTTGDELRIFLEERLAQAKVPRGFHFWDQHLRSEDGKCRRSEVASLLAAKVSKGAPKSKVADSVEQLLSAAPVSSTDDTRNFKGRVAIVTGAGNGLGREYAMLLGRRGAKVVVNDLGSSLSGKGTSSSSADMVVQAIQQAGGEAVANYDSVTDGDKIVKTAGDACGRVDIVINNAGILRDVSFRKMSDDDWDKVYQVHLKGMFSVTHAAWPHMEKNEYGRIVNITSSTGLYGSFGQANYAAMKSAALGFTFTLALEGKKRDIRANVVAPLAASRMMESVRSKEELKMIPTGTMANLVGYLCHDSCESNGGVFEMGGHWISRLGYRRTRGARFQEGFTMDDVASRFAEISDFTDSESPTDADSGEVHSTQPPLSKL